MVKHEHKFYPYTDNLNFAFIKWGIVIYVTIEYACECGVTKSVRIKK